MRLAIINDYRNQAMGAADWSRLSDEIQIDVFNDILSDPKQAAARLQPYEIIVAAREETEFDKLLVDKLTKLKLLIVHGMQNAALDLEALAENGVTVCGTRYGFSNSTVELSWALILGLAKRISQEDAAIRNGSWGDGLSFGLTGKTLGVLGLGKLGTGVARVGLALDMNVIAWSTNLQKDRCASLGVRKVEKTELFRESDILSIHLVLSERTRGLVSAREIGLMKSSAYLINTSRGPIVDELALIQALESKKIAGAGLDVFNQEPLPKEHAFRGLENVLATSHIGGRTRENFIARYSDCFDNVLSWLNGSPLRVIKSN